MNLQELSTVAKELLEYAQKQSEVKEAEAYASINSLNVYRIVYHSDIPSNGLEEPKSEEDFGVSLRILFKDGKYGMGVSDSDLTQSAFKEAYEKAFESRVMDEDFHSLPTPKGKATFTNYHDEKIMKVDEEKAIQKSYDLLSGAFSALKEKNFKEGTNITGELDLISSKMAIASSTGIEGVDQHTNALATLTSNLEIGEGATGSSSDSSTHLDKIDCFDVGKSSMEIALKSQKPKSLESGNYPVVLSESVVGELFYSRFDVGVSSIDYNASPFIGKIGKKVGVEDFTVYDEPNLEGFIGSRGITDEGTPTEKVSIIENGVMKNYLSNDYYKKKNKDWEKFPAANGFRSGTERSYVGDVGINGTNTIVKTGDYSSEELIKEVKNGVFVGRLWYTYPINGYANPDFTSTIRGDSFIIENGEIVGALTPNSMRVLDSFDNFMESIVGIGKNAKVMQAWAQEEVIVAPQIALSKFRLQKIAIQK